MRAFQKLIEDTIGQSLWLVVVIVVGVLALATFALRSNTPGVEPQVLELTIDAVSTQSNLQIPTLAAYMTLTPVEAVLTGAAPTVSLGGRLEVRQFAAAASASSERGPLNYGAVQAAGPPNTPGCGDSPTAWATANPGDVATLTLLFPELVTPTGILVYETSNPGFITRIEVNDIYGETHIVYEAVPRLRAECPFVLVVTLPGDFNHKTTSITIHVDQTTSTAGWNQIDAVELIGIKH